MRPMDPATDGHISFDVLGCTDRERRSMEKACKALPEGGLRVLGRVVRLDRGYPLVCFEGGCLRAEHAVSLVKSTDTLSCVGDWVVLELPEGHDKGQIIRVLPRGTSCVRKDPAQRVGYQVLAANIDLVIVLQALSGGPLSQRRLEREMVTAYDGGARAAIVLTKADLADDLDAAVETARRAAPGAAVVVTSARDGSGIDEVRSLIPAGTVAALLGRSGVGKSTLVNALLGHQRQRTGEVRDDDEGRHTTVAREMVALPGGGVVVDIPGVRTLALWECGTGLDATFPEVAAAAQMCRFRDCTHTGEPGCGVSAAVASGAIDADRVGSYLALREEMDNTALQRERRSWGRS